MTAIINNDSINNLWAKEAPKCQRDLIIKKIACGIIAAANLAAIGTLLTYVVLYCPVSTRVLTFAPFVGGVVGALSYLNAPTAGLTTVNYESHFTPAFFVARTLTLFCFAPIVLTVRYMDWTNYSDPYVASAIVEDLKKKTFEEVFESYGSRAQTLAKYGFFTSSEQYEKFKNIYIASKKDLEKRQFLLNEKSSEAREKNLIATDKSLETQKKEWEQNQPLILSLPIPPIPDVSTPSSKIKLWVRKQLGFYLLTPSKKEVECHQ